MGEVERVLVAAKEGDLTTLRTFRRLVPFATDGFGASAVHHAARNGQLDCVKWLLETIGEDAKFKRSKTGATALHDAAAQGHLECVKFFVQKCSVPVDVCDVSGHSPLHLAARFGRLDVVKWLLYEGNGNPKAKSRNHMTPMHFAASGGSETCLELLLSKAGYSAVNDLAADGTTAAFLAAQDGNLKCLKYLQSIGGKCNTKTRDGILPIHGAAQNGHLDCLIYLIECGQASWADRDDTGATPAHYAASQGHVNVLQWLRTRGDISSVDNLGGTPLHDAAEQGEFECVRYLVDSAGLNVMQQDSFHATPVDLADKSAHRKCRDFLKIAASKQAKQLRKQNDSNKKPQVKKTDKERENLNLHQTTAASAGHPHLTAGPDSTRSHSHKPQATSAKVRVSFEDSVFKATQPPLTISCPLQESVNEGVLAEMSVTQNSGSKRPEKTGNKKNNSADLSDDGNSTTIKYEQRRSAKPGEEQGTNISRSGLVGRSAGMSRSLGDLRVASSPPKTPYEGTSSTQYQQPARKLSASARSHDSPIPCPQSCSADIMMTRLKTGHFVPLPHIPVIPPPREFSGDERDKDDGLFGVNPIIWQAMPQWKRQVHLNRRRKEEEMRKLRQQQEDEELKKWMGIPVWRVPLIVKKEREQLKEEQKWAGVPEWKKAVLLKKQRNSNGT